MRNVIILMFLLCFCLSIFAQTDGRVTTYKFSDNLNYNVYDVSKKSFITNKLEMMKTYELAVNTFEINTVTNEFSNLFFANNTVVKIEQNSEFRVDLFNMMLKDTNAFPYKISVDSYNMNLSLINGSAYFVVNKGSNDSAMLQTPLSNFGLDTGKYWVQANQKFVLVFILDGTLDVYDNITNKKETIQANNVVLIRPLEALAPHKIDVFVDKTTTSVKAVKPEQIKELLTDVDALAAVKNEVIFVDVSGNIVGVKVK
jgi:hypothetical protein